MALHKRTHTAVLGAVDEGVCLCEVRRGVQECIQIGQSSHQKGWHCQIRAVFECSS